MTMTSGKMMMRLLPGALSFALGGLPALCGQEWPQWRGPSRDGVAAGVKLPDPWPQKLRRLWRAEVGEGYSAPVTTGDRVVVLARQGDEEVLLCLSATDGRELWRDAYAAPFTPESYAKKHGKGPFATPTLHGGKVFAVGITGVLSCCDLRTGELLWRQRFTPDYKKPHPIWGAANSPLIEGDLCIVGIGTEDDGAIAALDAKSGKTVWKLSSLDPSYSSAVVANLAGRRQVVALARKKLVGIVPESGALLWERPYQVKYEQNAITPTIHRDVVVCSGWQKETECARISQAGGKMVAEGVWSNPQISFFMSSPVVHGEYLYGFAQRQKGSLVCLDLGDGKVQWSSPGRMGEYVSIVTVGDRLLVQTTEGELLVIAADPKAYRELHRVRVAETPVWAHPAVTADRLYVKDRNHLAAFAWSGY